MQLKKIHKGRKKTLGYSNYLLKVGSYGFKLMSNLRLTEKQTMVMERILRIKLKKFSTQLQKIKL